MPDLELRPVFMRWQVWCNRCRTFFYVDTEPESTAQEIENLEDVMVCELHPFEGHCIELA